MYRLQTKRRVTIFLRAGLILALLPVSLLAAEKLSGEEIKSVLSGVTITGLNPGGRSLEIRYRADGTMTINVPEKNFTNTGVWSVEDGKYCGQWDGNRGGGKRCRILYHEGGDRYIFEKENGEEWVGTLKK